MATCPARIDPPAQHPIKERPFEAASDHVRISSQGAFAIPYTWAKRGACHGLREMGPACGSAPVLGTSHDRDHGQTEIDKVAENTMNDSRPYRVVRERDLPTYAGSENRRKIIRRDFAHLGRTAFAR